MAARESLREVENLRFRFQMNNRLRLECLAAVSKVFREFDEPISDELLSGVVFALPGELVSNTGGFATMEQAAALPPEKPGLPPNQPWKPDKSDKPDKPKEKPGLPPESPALPPESPAPQPALPPESPARPGLPPEQPSQIASEYLA